MPPSYYTFREKELLKAIKPHMETRAYKKAERAAIAAAAILGKSHEVWLLCTDQSAIHDTYGGSYSTFAARALQRKTRLRKFLVLPEYETGEEEIDHNPNSYFVCCLFWVTPEAAWKMMKEKKCRTS